MGQMSSTGLPGKLEKIKGIIRPLDKSEIQAVAYEFYLTNGASNGHGLCNWLAAERELWMLHLMRVGHRLSHHIVAILILPLKEGIPDTSRSVGGTGGLIDTGERQLLITADHVVREFDDRRASGEKVDIVYLGDHGSPPFDFERCTLIDRHEELDLAVFELPKTMHPLALGKNYFKQPGDWPPEKLTKGELVGLTGLPGLHRGFKTEELETKTLITTSLNATTLQDNVSSSSDRHAVLADEHGGRRQFSLQRQLPPLGPLGGMSGCPVFVERDHGVECAGVFYEALEDARPGQGHRSTLLVNHLHYVNADGTLNLSELESAGVIRRSGKPRYRMDP